MTRREAQFRAYDSILRSRMHLPFKTVMDTKNYSWLFYPVSEDERLHYEFLANGTVMEVSIHFEGEYAKYENVIDEIISQNDLQMALDKNKGAWKGCHYTVGCQDYPYVAQIMQHLMRLSLPVLAKHRLIPDKLALDLSY